LDALGFCVCDRIGTLIRRLQIRTSGGFLNYGLQNKTGLKPRILSSVTTFLA